MAAVDFTIYGTETTDWDWSADVPSVTTPPAGSMRFYGAAGYGQGAYDSKIDIEDFTIAFFVKDDGATTSRYFLARGTDWSIIQGYSDRINYYDANVGTQCAVAPGDTDWHHVAYINSGGTLNAYKDGVFSSTGSANPNQSTTDLFLSDYNGGGTYSGNFYITNLFIWNTAKDVSFIADLATGTVPSAASSNLILRYLFNEGSGTTVADSSDYTPPPPPSDARRNLLLMGVG